MPFNRYFEVSFHLETLTWLWDYISQSSFSFFIAVCLVWETAKANIMISIIGIKQAFQLNI